MRKTTKNRPVDARMKTPVKKEGKNEGGKE